MSTTETPSRWRTLAATDPEIADAIAHEQHRQNTGLELIASENFVSQAVLEAAGSVLTNKYAEGYPGQALLRRLRVRRRRRVAGDRAREAAVRRRARQRAAALGRAGQHGGLLHAAEAGRHRARHEPRARRPPDARPSAQLLRQALQDRPLRRPQGRRADRLRGAGAARARAQAEDDHGRRQRLPADHRLRAHRRRRQGDRRARRHRHGAHRRPGRGGGAPEPGAPLRLRDHHHAQDAARPARRHGALPGAVREGSRSHGVPRHPGRPADARHRRQGGVLQGSAGAGVRRLPAADRRQREAARRRAVGRRLPPGQRRHRQPPDAGRRLLEGPHRQGRRGRARQGRHHRQQERDPVRSEPADGRERHPHRHAGDHQPRHARAGNGSRRRVHRRALASPDDDAALGRVKGEVEALCRKFPLYPEVQG